MFETGFERNAKRCARISGRDWKARWARQSARADQIARATNGRDPRDETRGYQSGQAVASTRPQTAEALLKISVLIIHHKPLTMDQRDGCSFRCLPQAWVRLRVRARSRAPELISRPQVSSIV